MKNAGMLARHESLSAYHQQHDGHMPWLQRGRGVQWDRVWVCLVCQRQETLSFSDSGGGGAVHAGGLRARVRRELSEKSLSANYRPVCSRVASTRLWESQLHELTRHQQGLMV